MWSHNYLLGVLKKYIKMAHQVVKVVERCDAANETQNLGKVHPNYQLKHILKYYGKSFPFENKFIIALFMTIMPSIFILVIRINIYIFYVC